MKQLAAEADERWKSKPSFLDAPKRQQPEAPTAITDSKPVPEAVDEKSGADLKSPVGDQKEVDQASGVHSQDQARKKSDERAPWATTQKGAPGEKWEPASWTPGVAKRR